MLGKCVLSVSGIVNKQIVKVDHHAGYDFFMLLTDVKNNNEYGMTFLEHDGFYFHIANNKERIKMFLDQNPNFDLLKYVTEQFEQQLQAGKHINKGLAQYLGRTEEAQQAIEAYRKTKEAEQQEREEQKRQEELIRLKNEEKRILAVEAEYIKGNSINNDDFLTLCDKYEIYIPIRTRGWIINSLKEIGHEDGVTSFKFTGNQSSTIGRVASDLYKALNETEETTEATEEELQHLFG